MLKKLKKAFTIVELVIVIAVIAILAAVLIPTFINVVNKANESSDISAVRNMNTYLAIEDATKGNLTTHDVFETLSENGMDGKNYTPLYSGRYYFYDQNENRIVYTDGDYNVIYPEGMEKGTHQWYSLNGNINTSSATIVLPTSTPSAGDTTTFSISSAADFVKAAEYVTEYNSAFTKSGSTYATIKIEINADIDLMGADVNFASESLSNKASVEIDGNSHTLSGLYTSDGHAHLGKGSMGTAATYGAALFNSVRNLTVKNITVINSTVGDYSVSQAAIFAGKVSGTATFENVTVKNSTVYGNRKNGILLGYSLGTVSLTNVTLEGNSVYTLEGESGVLIGVATCKSNDKFFTVSNLKMENNNIAFAESAVTFKVEGTSVTAGGLTFKTLPLNNEFAYKWNTDVTTVVYTEGRLGLAAVCFIGNHPNYLMDSPYDYSTSTIAVNGKNIKVKIACAVNSVDELTSEIKVSDYYSTNS